jgi:large subunit ribosomal protein L5
MKIQKLTISCQNQSVLKQITGQQPSAVFAKKSIANFSIREGQSMSFFVTLRKKRLSTFLERFCRVILPAQSRFQGFQSVSMKPQEQSFTIGLSDCLPFFEISEKHDEKIGLNISFTIQDSNFLSFDAFLKNFAEQS